MEFFIDRLREELKTDEGCKYEIYLDHLGLPTFGIGHLVVKGDPEFKKEVGTPVAEIRVNEVFEQDIGVTINDCKKVYNEKTINEEHETGIKCVSISSL